LVNFSTFEDVLLKISARDDEEKGAFSYYGEREYIVDGMGSFIDYYGTNNLRDAKGKRLGRNKTQRFLRLKRINDLQLHTMNRESDYRALRVLNRMTGMFQLTKHIRSRAAYLLRIMSRFLDSSPGLNRIILVATALYIAMRENPEGNPITLAELVEGFQDQGHRISKRLIVRALWTLRPKLTDAIDFTKILSRTQDYIATVIQKLQTSENVKQRINARGLDEGEYYKLISLETRKLLEKIPYQARGGRNPYIFTVSAVYAADRLITNKEKKYRPVLSQKAIAQATNVAEYSVRDHFARVITQFID
jgi:transcription initiation factor TFIIIB Brf1 subunit/transcription initiation factor TFIIB